jgi:hypothetical protein
MFLYYDTKDLCRCGNVQPARLKKKDSILIRVVLEDIQELQRRHFTEMAELVDKKQIASGP